MAYVHLCAHNNIFPPPARALYVRPCLAEWGAHFSKEFLPCSLPSIVLYVMSSNVHFECSNQARLSFCRMCSSSLGIEFHYIILLHRQMDNNLEWVVLRGRNEVVSVWGGGEQSEQTVLSFVNCIIWFKLNIREGRVNFLEDISMDYYSDILTRSTRYSVVGTVNVKRMTSNGSRNIKLGEQERTNWM